MPVQWGQLPAMQLSLPGHHQSHLPEGPMLLKPDPQQICLSWLPGAVAQPHQPWLTPAQRWPQPAPSPALRLARHPSPRHHRPLKMQPWREAGTGPSRQDMAALHRQLRAQPQLKTQGRVPRQVPPTVVTPPWGQPHHRQPLPQPVSLLSQAWLHRTMAITLLSPTRTWTQAWTWTWTQFLPPWGTGLWGCPLPQLRWPSQAPAMPPPWHALPQAAKALWQWPSWAQCHPQLQSWL